MLKTPDLRSPALTYCTSTLGSPIYGRIVPAHFGRLTACVARIPAYLSYSSKYEVPRIICRRRESQIGWPDVVDGLVMGGLEAVGHVRRWPSEHVVTFRNLTMMANQHVG